MGWSRQEVLDVARSTGETVVEAWSDHNAGTMGTVVGPMLHHTGSAWSWPRLTAPTLRTVREGRSDLLNSLCMYYIDYAGVIYCVSEKLSWHAGAGAWAGVTDGNGHYAGIEAESDGARWTDATLRAYKKLAAAILRKAGRDIAYAPRHAEYALPKGRKTDFSGYDAKLFLKDVAGLLTGGQLQEDDVPLTEIELNAIGDRIANRVIGTAADGKPLYAWQAWRDSALKSVDVNALAAAIIGKLPTAATGGLSKADVAAAVREVFADAGTA